MRLLADTNIVALAVRALRDLGHDVFYSAERDADPGDDALLAQAVAEGRVFVTKDHDIGALIHRDGRNHRGVLLIDDLGDPKTENDLILGVLTTHGEQLTAGAFLRVSASGVREAQD